MNTHQLEAFHVVMASGSFTRGGKGFRISQPAVSKMVALLDRECGFVLFHRRKNVVGPRAEARLLFAEAEPVFVGTAAISEHIKAIKAQRVGDLGIVTFPALSIASETTQIDHEICRIGSRNRIQDRPH
jgi:DNA-binding transcriptional LysR family regulator